VTSILFSKLFFLTFIIAGLVLAFPRTNILGNEPPSPQEVTAHERQATGSSKKLEPEISDYRNRLNESLKRFLTQITFRGHFTTDKKGSENELPKQDEYTITSATHVSGDYWLLTSRMQYRDIDITLPVPVVIRWAGTTPVITLEEVTLPGMGTFSSRVLIHKNRYTGTWQHGDVGGHLFGTLSKNETFADIPTK
jgi:hypothetical protein